MLIEAFGYAVYQMASADGKAERRIAMRKYLLLSFVCFFVLNGLAFAEVPKIVVATDASAPPFEALNGSGQIEGFEIDLLNAAAKAGNFTIEFKNVGWDNIFSGLQAGSFDAIISALTITDERKKTMDFSIPYIKSGEVLIVKSDAKEILSLSDLSGKVVTTQSNTVCEAFLNKIKETNKITAKFSYELDPGIMDTLNGKSAAFLYDYVYAKYFILQMPSYKGRIKFAGPLLNEEFYGVAVKKGNAKVLNLLNEGLKKIIDSGQNKSIEQRWLK